MGLGQQSEEVCVYDGHYVCVCAPAFTCVCVIEQDDCFGSQCHCELFSTWTF